MHAAPHITGAVEPAMPLLPPEPDVPPPRPPEPPAVLQSHSVKLPSA
jgi:hypothetical protein